MAMVPRSEGANGSGHPLSMLLVGILLVGNIIQAARIFDLFWEDASRFGYIAQAVPIVIYTVVALYRRRWMPVLFAAAILALLIGSHAQFAAAAGTIPNYNSIATFVPLLTFIVFLEAGYPIEKILRVLLVASGTYLVAYLALGPIIRQDYASSAYILLQGHDGDDKRLYLAAAYAAFIMMYGLRAGHVSMALRAILILLGAVTLWLSDTRAMILIVLAVFALGAFNLLIRPVRIAIFCGVLFVMLLLMAGFIFPDWNPYSSMIGDSSGAYRAIEYNWVTRILAHDWLTGVGTPGKLVELQNYLQRSFSVPRNIWIFATDLGPLGAYFQFGLVGLLGFITAIAFCTVTRWRVGSPEIEALQMTAFACAIYGTNSPLLVMEPSSIFLTLLIGMNWRERHMRKQVARPAQRPAMT